MPTAACSPEPRHDLRRSDPSPAGLPRAVADTWSLVRFRLAASGRGARVGVPVALWLGLTVTLVVAVGPALLPEQAVTRAEVLALLPFGCLGLLGVVAVSGVAAGGGRELLERDQAVAFPLGPLVDHLGALLLAPLSSAWLLQAWGLLGATSYAVGARPGLVAALVPVLTWLLAATALGQALAWLVEWGRRGPHGGRHGCAVLAAVVVAGAAAVGTHRLPVGTVAVVTRPVAAAVAAGATSSWGRWLALTVGLGLVAALALPAGAWLAGRVARLPSRAQDRAETAVRSARPHPGSDLLALLRVDRAGVWRSVPTRRGMAVLAAFPAVLAVSGGFGWDTLGVLPGLVASGGALLFGVNAWSLDGRGARWRESLPVSPRLGFVSRALVLAEILLLTIVATVLVASLRAGPPSSSQLSAVVAAGVVVTVQVVARALRWSVRRPCSVDLRSLRVTPAPPLVMVGYSARLALTTTATGLLFGALTVAPWTWSPVAAAPFLVWSGLSLRRTARAWDDPAVRAGVVATVAG